VIAYANDVKSGMLGVRSSTLERHGAVSGQTAVEMATGVREALGAGIGVGVTGIAGPGGGGRRKPVGLVWIGISSGSGVLARRFVFDGRRAAVRAQAVSVALVLLENRIRREKKHGKEAG
jgi:PncC family amidohydrolase